MENRIVAVCGLTCSECEAYQATQANDEAWKERVATKWREEYNNPGFDAATVTCDGCMPVEGRHCSHCSFCDIRKCGIEHGASTCAACAEYESCERINNFFKFVPQAKVTLDSLRGG